MASKKNRFSGVFQPSVFGGSHLLTSRSFPRFGVISNLTLFDSANRVKPPPRGDVSMHPNGHILMVPKGSPVTPEEILNPGWILDILYNVSSSDTVQGTFIFFFLIEIVPVISPTKNPCFLYLFPDGLLYTS